MAEVKHEPTNTKQINYPGGKDGMWNSSCSAGDYVSPPSDTPARAAAHVRQHAASKVDNAENVQILKEEYDTVEINTELAHGKFEMCVTKTNQWGDGTTVASKMDYDQLWEHVHNCLDALVSMGRK